MAENPVLVERTGRFGLPPFAAITDADFEPAFAAALTEARANITAIAGQTNAPTFDTTIKAMELNAEPARNWSVRHRTV